MKCIRPTLSGVVRFSGYPRPGFQSSRPRPAETVNGGASPTKRFPVSRSAVPTVPATPSFWTPPPHGVVALRRPISMVMMGKENDVDHADRTSDGLPRSRGKCFQRLSSAIATLGIVRNDLETGMDCRKQCQEWHVRPNANVRGRVPNPNPRLTTYDSGTIVPCPRSPPPPSSPSPKSARDFSRWRRPPRPLTRRRRSSGLAAGSTTKRATTAGPAASAT